MSPRLLFLEVGRGRHEPQQLGRHPARVGIAVTAACELHQRCPRVARDGEGAHLVQRGLDDVFGLGRPTAGAEAIHHRTDAGLTGVGELLRCVVHTIHQAARVDPLDPLVPSLDAGRVNEVLPHYLELPGVGLELGTVDELLAGQPQHPGHQLSRALDLLVRCVLGPEEVGQE